VVFTGGDRLGALVCSDVDGAKGGHFSRGVACINGVVPSQAAKDVEAPTFDGAVVEEGTGV
tara:strand:+ start:882 stop:1064 length:183 start_codon:yes stop_codon:yes gene_type:complete